MPGSHVTAMVIMLYGAGTMTCWGYLGKVTRTNWLLGGIGLVSVCRGWEGGGVWAVETMGVAII